MDLQWEKSPHLEAHYEGQEKTSKGGLQRPRRAPTKEGYGGQEEPDRGRHKGYHE